MLGTLTRRVTVVTLNRVVQRGQRSSVLPLRWMAEALRLAQKTVGLAQIPTSGPLPQWQGRQVERPMWESDRKKLHKWQVEHGIVKDESATEAKPQRKVAAPELVEVYLTRGCPYARAAMDLLRERDIHFVQHDVTSDPERRAWLQTVTGKKTTPQTFIGGQLVGGYDDLRRIDQSGELARMLAGTATGRRDEDALTAVVDDEISVAQLQAHIDDGGQVRLLDVRENAEVKSTGLLPGAVHIPMAQLASRASDLEHDAVWVVYCHAGVRSANVLPILRGLGLHTAVSLRGGVLAWKSAGGQFEPVSSAGGPTATSARRVGLPVLHPSHSPFETAPAGWDDASDAGQIYEGEALIARVREVLDECRPMVQLDGGDIELLDVQGDTVHLQLTGNCVGCPSSQATLRQGIERRLKAKIPQLKGIASPQLQR